MRTEFNAMMETANDKYIKLIDAIYRLKNGSEVDFEKLSNLVNSIYHDELELIVMLDDIERNRIQSKKGPQIFNFMMK
jgi:hypothetical protein